MVSPWTSDVKMTMPNVPATMASRSGSAELSPSASAIATPPRRPPQTRTGRHALGTGWDGVCHAAVDPQTVIRRTIIPAIASTATSGQWRTSRLIGTSSPISKNSTEFARNAIMSHSVFSVSHPRSVTWRGPYPANTTPAVTTAITPLAPTPSAARSAPRQAMRLPSASTNGRWVEPSAYDVASATSPPITMPPPSSHTNCRPTAQNPTAAVPPTIVNRMIATPSLRIASPSRTVPRRRSRPVSRTSACTLTGSTADTIAPSRSALRSAR